MEAKKLRIVYMGTPDFAVSPLAKLVEEGYNVVGVVTMPDKPSGRGLHVQQSAVKRYALQAGLPVYQPEKLRDPAFVETFRSMRPDLGIVIAFRMLPEIIWAAPKLGTFNLHASLLPQYRGAAPINWALINGEKITGVTTMFTDIGLDTGDMLLKRELEILPGETAGELFERLSRLGAEVLLDTLKALEENVLIRIKQDENQPSYYPMIKKEDGLICFNKTPVQIENFVRGMTPWPGAYCFLGEERLKAGKALPCEFIRPEGAMNGEILASDAKNGLILAAAGGTVRLAEIQLPGQRMMRDVEYLRGHSIKTGERLRGAETV